MRLSTLASAIALVVVSATMAYGQTVAPPDKDKPAAAPQQQAAPSASQAQPSAAPTAPTQQAKPADKPVVQAAAPTRLGIGAKAPACSAVATPTAADAGYKQVTVTRPLTGIPVGTGIGVNVPGKLGLDRVDADKQLVTMVQECDGGQTYALRAVLTNVTATAEVFTILVPETAKPFEIRSCSPRMKGACAYGAFKGDLAQTVALGAFLGN